MSEFSYPFDGGEGSFITEEQWSRMAASWQDNGVDAEGPWNPDLKVSKGPQPYSVNVEPGQANLAGFRYQLTARQTIPLSGNATAYSRIDLLVLRLNREINRVSLAVRQGAPAATPVAPNANRTWAEPEIPLAQFKVLPNASSDSVQEIKDVREYVGRRILVFPHDPIPRGSIVYQPEQDRFLAVKSTGSIELGAPPDLSGYVTIPAGDDRWAAKNHRHVGTVSDHYFDTGLFTPVSTNWQHAPVQSFALSTGTYLFQLTLSNAGNPINTSWGLMVRLQSADELLLIGDQKISPSGNGGIQHGLTFVANDGGHAGKSLKVSVAAYQTTSSIQIFGNLRQVKLG
ncbi:hypothetical protein ACFWY5_29835 [Nonomuraea sp. NPDC059007]|uniref:hypothetical protein n=1 Tax=Nonomuraea sp. NPDC059007 TaxID=3346692 RepID=UPI0036A008B9